MQLPYVEKSSVSKPQGMSIPHMHHFYELYILTEGERSIYIENDIFEMKKNSLVCFPPQQLHRTEGSAHTRYIINFSPDDLSPAEKELVSFLEKQIIPLSVQETENILAIINTIQRVQDNYNKDFMMEKRATANACLRYLIIVLSQLTNFPDQKYTSPDNYTPRVREVLVYIHEHYTEKISLSALAQMFFVSKPTLCNEFKKCTLMSIADYILTFRLTQAQDLLICSHRRNLNEIAQMCGLTSAKYMGLMFKKKLGVSPAEYRKKNKNQTPKNI